MRRHALIVLAVVATVLGLVAVIGTAGSATATRTECVLPSQQVDTTVTPSLGTVSCPVGDAPVSWSVNVGPPVTAATATTLPATTTSAATTTTAAPTTTAATTTTQPGTKPAFLSYPHQSCTTSISGGTNVVVNGKSWQGCTGAVALKIANVNGLTLTNLDFDSNGGDIYLSHVSGNVTIAHVRARNTGDGTIGSGHSNVIQFANSYVNGDVTDVNSYGGRTEDMVSIWESGGIDSAHPLVIEHSHFESPLPPDPLAWTSTSGTCINAADGIDSNTHVGGHDIVVRSNTLLNCGAVGLQMNNPLRVSESGNTVYLAARANSNVGLSQWASTSCSACVGNSYTLNQVFAVKSNGTASASWLSHTASVSIDTQSSKNDPTTPQIHVAL